MGRKIEVKDSLNDAHVTRIDGRLNNEGMMKLLIELLAIATSVPTTKGGGSHRHMGMLLDNAKYRTFSTGGTPFYVLTNPSSHPTTVNATNVVVRASQVAKH